MSPTLRLFLGSVVAVLPPFLALWFILNKRKKFRALNKLPFQDLRRRPAGEGLREKLEWWDDRINESALMMIAIPYMAGAMLAWGSPIKSPFLIIAAFSIVWSAVYGWRFYRDVQGRSNYQLGYDGERFVGEELSRLLVNGFEVYHDVQFDGFNIDHVLVGPPGVFCVETKTRRKPVTAAGAKQFRVTFDGTSLHWPWGRDEYGVQQAINNAKTLSQFLSGATGESVLVVPILTLPGWMVDCTTDPKRSKVQVMNPKQIHGFCTCCTEQLSPDRLKRICYQLDQKCKLNLS